MKNANPLKQQLKKFKDELCEHFCQHASINHLNQQLIHFIDTTLIQLFHKHMLDNSFCLLAIGGYGRRELQLHSDVDLLLLHDTSITEKKLQQAQAFIQECWDIGLDISHQITNVEACSDLASQDLSVISSLMSMHLICGRTHLMEALLYQIHPSNMWSSKQFLIAKLAEQTARYLKYGETAYNLEPNVKQGPGGLRDLQLIQTVSQRYYGIKKLSDGIHHNFITEREYEEILHNQHFLWRVRFGLHMLAEKQSDCLLFDYQIKLASLFGFVDDQHSLGIEKFMKAYFKIIKHIRETTETLLQGFSEKLLYNHPKIAIPLDNHFQLIDQYIEVRHAHVFSLHPYCLLEIFVWLAQRTDIHGVSAVTIRLISQNLHLLTNTLLTSTLATDAFLTIFKSDHPYKALNYMSKYGVLNHYLDCFAEVSGQMQYDLFHVYTVDQHTLFVIRNLTRFLDPNYQTQFPLATKLMASISKKYILYLAALFHDIAKGRGGDHSELGAEEARRFAQRHHLSYDDTALLVWLVLHHLLMSQTAQRQDIYDLQVIENFCQKLPHAYYLDYLYLLTVADICATNQKLWNSWKDSLLKELYHAANNALQQKALNEDDLIDLRKQQAKKLLLENKISMSAIDPLWDTFDPKYFLHESPPMIALHTQTILNSQTFPVITILPHHNLGGTEVFIYMPHRDERFTIATTVLSNYQMTIQEATILRCANEFDLDTYIILDEQHQPLTDNERVTALHAALQDQLIQSNLPKIAKRRLSRTQAHFKIKPQITYTDTHCTCLFLIVSDQVGLLAKISHIFSQHHIHLHNAKIATAGERVEDMFMISDKHGKPLSAREKEALRRAIVAL